MLKYLGGKGYRVIPVNEGIARQATRGSPADHPPRIRPAHRWRNRPADIFIHHRLQSLERRRANRARHREGAATARPARRPPRQPSRPPRPPRLPSPGAPAAAMLKWTRRDGIGNQETARPARQPINGLTCRDQTPPTMPKRHSLPPDMPGRWLEPACPPPPSTAASRRSADAGGTTAACGDPTSRDAPAPNSPGAGAQREINPARHSPTPPTA